MLSLFVYIQASNICYLSFPDSNSGCMGDTQYYFRTRTCPKSALFRQEFGKTYRRYNESCLQTLQVDSDHLYGFVYFRQVKDTGLKRGYFQKSLVILSWFPFASLFSRVLSIFAPKFFEHGVKVLEAACSDICRWPNIVAGDSIKLPILGSIVSILVPDDRQTAPIPTQNISGNGLKKFTTATTMAFKSFSLSKLKKSLQEQDNFAPQDENVENAVMDDDFELVMEPTVSPNSILNLSNDINIYRALLPLVSHCQLMWELVLTGEPIAVIASTPNMCSQVVQALVHSITPLKYGAEYRPFFTIHDSEFKEFTSHNRSQ